MGPHLEMRGRRQAPGGDRCLLAHFAAAPTRGLARTKEAIYAARTTRSTRSSTSSAISCASWAAATTTAKASRRSWKSGRRGSPAVPDRRSRVPRRSGRRHRRRHDGRRHPPIAALWGTVSSWIDGAFGAGRQGRGGHRGHLRRAPRRGRPAAAAVDACVCPRIADPGRHVARCVPRGLVVEAIASSVLARRARSRRQPPSSTACCCILASNTSPLSITALGRLQHRGASSACISSPVPLMPLVEVGLGSRPIRRVAARLAPPPRPGASAGARGVDPGLDRDPLCAAVLRRGVAPLAERAAEPATIDAVVRVGGRGPDGAVRADGPGRRRRQRRGSTRSTSGTPPPTIILLHAVGAAARAGRRGLPRLQERPLVHVREDAAMPSPQTEARDRGRRASSCTATPASPRRWSRAWPPPVSRSSTRLRRHAGPAVRALPLPGPAGRWAGASSDGRTATARAAHAGVQELDGIRSRVRLRAPPRGWRWRAPTDAARPPARLPRARCRRRD